MNIIYKHSIMDAIAVDDGDKYEAIDFRLGTILYKQYPYTNDGKESAINQAKQWNDDDN